MCRSHPAKSINMQPTTSMDVETAIGKAHFCEDGVGREATCCSCPADAHARRKDNSGPVMRARTCSHHARTQKCSPLPFLHCSILMAWMDQHHTKLSKHTQTISATLFSLLSRLYVS